MKFPSRTSVNPGGRPKGAHPIRRAALVGAFNRAVAPHTEELMQRAVAQALAGDNQALTGLLTIIGQAMHTSASAPAGQPAAATAA
ncbi:hypothetical protein C6568_17410 [Melaminivora suipulveris]|uniref:DUF5681 domain-containing protein n=1 Tax=Melaminivora suipulveris TaxID=2109913 RepID=A0A2R3QGA0_9BURK|nr:hypothetical protein [Melaminivora suipulveris]AVO50803.1 hypothetical protein C6568_17410 [Melaminivora suipulveris]